MAESIWINDGSRGIAKLLRVLNGYRSRFANQLHWNAAVLASHLAFVDPVNFDSLLQIVRVALLWSVQPLTLRSRCSQRLRGDYCTISRVPFIRDEVFLNINGIYRVFVFVNQIEMVGRRHIGNDELCSLRYFRSILGLVYQLLLAAPCLCLIQLRP